MDPRILIIDDDASFREVMAFHLQEAGHACDLAPDGEEGLRLFDPRTHAVVVTDLKMHRVTGMDVLRHVKRRAPDTLVVVITAFGDVGTAVEAMKAGAFDFLPKPCDRDHLKLTIARALEHSSLKAKIVDLSCRLDSHGKEIIYSSEKMARVVAMAERVASADGVVLILGESGTGKELVARRVHQAGRRASGPFVALSCAAIPRELLESELFGHAKGAFTGAVRERKGKFVQAHGGTIVLDEVAELPVELQTRLLRVLQEREVSVVGSNEQIPVDVRVVSATNRDLRRAVETGAFREDLYFRLAVFPIEIPPLRERREDIAPLVRYFLQRYAADSPLCATDGLLARLSRQDWRGNVRELENVCQRLAHLSDDDTITEDMLDDAVPSTVTPTAAGGTIELPPGGISLVDLERDVIARALEMNGYNQAQTARFLRIPRHVLLYRIDKYKIALKNRS